jgi:hypothetical protein
VLFETLKDPNKYRLEGARHDWLEELADLIITGNRFYAKQGVGIIVPLVVLQAALILQKRRRLGEKDAKGA